ncbi:WD40-repeat-containing domain protein, partial [Thamnocephalis sphaerospora]
SCVSWSHNNTAHLASSDYDGAVTVLDTFTGKPVIAYVEHECRVWTVDYAPLGMQYLASGSDDAKVKIWSTNQRRSTLTISSLANVCTVRFNPYDSNHIVFGSADHNAWYYDLRYPSRELFKCSDHRKAISCVRYVDSNHFVTASTDGTLRMWNHKETGQCVRKYEGHINDKNFVGLSVSSDGNWLSCGSEDNHIYTYFTPITRPAIQTPFAAPSIVTGRESHSDDPTLFVSAVAWRRTENVMIAGNSHGVVKMLELAEG